MDHGDDDALSERALRFNSPSWQAPLPTFSNPLPFVVKWLTVMYLFVVNKKKDQFNHYR